MVIVGGREREQESCTFATKGTFGACTRQGMNRGDLMNGYLRSALAGLLLATLVASSAAQAAAQPRDLRQEILDAARVRGVDATSLFAREIALPGGTVTLGALIDEMSAVRAQASGIGGTPETQVGDTFHFAYNFGGSDVRHIYEVTTSATVPATNPVVVPIPATPVSDVQVFVEYGGPVRQIRTNPFALGVHMVGGPMTNIDTAPGGDAIYVSGRSGALLPDTSLDFTGHVGGLVNDRSCVFGFCFSLGVLLGDGVTFYNNDPIANGVPRPPTPTIP